MKRLLLLVTVILGGCSGVGSYYDFRDNMTDGMALSYYDTNGLCRLKDAHATLKGNWMAGGLKEWPDNEERLLKLIKAKGTFSDEEMELIASRKIRVGMSELATYCSWGFPIDTNDSVGSWGRHRQAVMGRDTYFYFENGELKSWQN